MRLATGTRLGPYEILALLGAGGMGEVYRARDTRLDRTVAIKILSPDIASSPDARARFEREARTISQLSHPHICALFDVGEAEPPAPGTQPLQYLVMELLEGETLAQRLTSGALPLDQTLRYATQIADALDKAHRAGIVHRDLKPANVMVTRTGVKLLDFGLAKVHQPLLGAGESHAKTAMIPGVVTEEGRFLGTLQYTSPEQLEGGEADSRSDLFALGSVLFEMATGRKAFAGASHVALASAVLREQPPAPSSVNPAIPAALDVLIRGCLAKDPDHRWQHAGDVTMQLTAIEAASTSDAKQRDVATLVRKRRGLAVWVPWLVATAALIAAVSVGLRLRTPSAVGTVTFLVSPPTGTRFSDTVETVPFALSPDGSSLAMVAYEPNGSSRVWLRMVSDAVPRPIAGTEGADGVFWSPDGRSVGFFAGPKLKRVDIGGGAVVPLCDVAEGIGKGGTWGRDGQVLFTSVEGDAIYRTSTAGEAAVAEVKPNRSDAGVRVTWPSFLPDGRRYLYLERTTLGGGWLMLGEAGHTSRQVMPVESNVQYVSAGYLMFAREGVLLGQKFDLSSARPVGEPFSIANPVRYFFPTGLAQFSASLNGALVYLQHGFVARATRVDRNGRELDTLGTPGENGRIHLSRDGQTAFFDRSQPGMGTIDVWSIDVGRGVEARLTTAPGTEAGAVMVPGTHSIIFGSTNRGGPPNLARKNLETGAEDYLLPFTPSLQMPEDITPDGRILLYSQRAKGGQFDLWTVPLNGNATPTPYLASQADETSARIAPDGRFVAYLSNDSGRYEVQVDSFPQHGAPTRVSSGGARLPRWSPDGHELFFIATDGQFMTVPVRPTPTLEVGRPMPLFSLADPQRWIGFDVLRDGRFLAMISESTASEQAITVVLSGIAGGRP